MKHKHFWVIGLLVLVQGCSYTYQAADLNVLQIGMARQDFLGRYSEVCGNNQRCESPIVRAAQTGSDGVLVEVLTLGMLDRGSKTDFWFVFKNSRLVQWGRPEDWQQVSGRYEVSFNPGPSVRR